MKINKTILLLSLAFTFALSQDSEAHYTPGGSLPYLEPDYTPKGEESALGDLPIYTHGESNKAVIMVYDIYGFNGGRTRAMSDQIADAGYFVILPDFFRGGFQGKSEEFATRDWLNQYTWERINEDLTTLVYPYLESRGIEKTGMVGSCWGGWIVFESSAGDKLSAGVSFHPSLSRGTKTPDQMAEAVAVPQMVLAAGNDPVEVQEGGSIEAILKAKPFGG